MPCLLNQYLCCVGATINRKKIRDALGYDQKLCLDIATHLFCMPCGVCQEWRETLDNSLGKAAELGANLMNQATESTPMNSSTPTG